MMYEMLTGEMPVLPETSSFGSWYKAHHDLQPEPFNPELNLPSPLQRLVMKCLAKSPDQRPQGVEEVSQALKELALRDSLITWRRSLSDKEDYSEKETVYSARNCDGESQSVEAPIHNPIDKICLEYSWPKDKPQGKIVFPALIPSETEPIPTLWAMLDSSDILTHKSSTRYNQFLFMTKPHPMMLWITVLYKRSSGAKWLPCYLDLKTNTGQRLTHILGEQGSYRILLFALDKPQSCEHQIHASIAPKQCDLLQEWAKNSRTLKGSNKTQVSKQRLKQEFEKLKPKILMKLEGVQVSS